MAKEKKVKKHKINNKIIDEGAKVFMGTKAFIVEESNDRGIRVYPEEYPNIFHPYSFVPEHKIQELGSQSIG